MSHIETGSGSHPLPKTEIIVHIHSEVFFIPEGNKNSFVQLAQMEIGVQENGDRDGDC